MNNIFSFSRFKNLLVNDAKMYIRNFGPGFVVFCCFSIILWIFDLLLATETDGAVRFIFICVGVILAMILAPSKIYGHANLSREGVGFAMMPTSSLEKFLSMFIYCAIVTPVLVFCGGYLIDILLSLLPFGGFESPIHLFMLNEVAHMANDTEGAVQAGEMRLLFEEVFPIGVIRVSFYVGIIQWAAIFMLGNMLFKKHKALKTVGCYLGITYLMSIVAAAVFYANADQWYERIKDYSAEESLDLIHSIMVCGMVINIVITVLLLFFTYRKIKTQKY